MTDSRLLASFSTRERNHVKTRPKQAQPVFRGILLPRLLDPTLGAPFWTNIHDDEHQRAGSDANARKEDIRPAHAYRVDDQVDDRDAKRAEGTSDEVVLGNIQSSTRAL